MSLQPDVVDGPFEKPSFQLLAAHRRLDGVFGGGSGLPRRLPFPFFLRLGSGFDVTGLFEAAESPQGRGGGEEARGGGGGVKRGEGEGEKWG